MENNIIIYQTQDGKTKIDVKIEQETVWLTQAQMVELFQSSKGNISEHISHIFEEGELDENSVVRNFRITAKTTFKGNHPRKDEVTVAKNYLDEKELNILNRITSAYLEFAELQAIRQIPMTMKDWIAKLDDFIKMTGSELLENPGTISKLEAENKALEEYTKYKETIKDELSEVEKHFLENVKKAQKHLEKKTKE